MLQQQECANKTNQTTDGLKKKKYSVVSSLGKWELYCTLVF